MASLRFGSFKPNWWALGLAGAFSLAFIVYIAGFTTFKRNYTALYDAQNEAALNNMKWFLVGCPILMLVTSILLFVVASFESRQILLGFCALFFIGGLGFLLIVAWLGSNITKFHAEGGWETCAQDPKCGKLKTGSYVFLFGSLLCCLTSFAQICFCVWRAKQIQQAESNYQGLSGENALNEMDELGDIEEYPQN